MRTNFGFNVLATAQTVIRKQIVSYIQYAGRTKNAIGNYVSSYEVAVDMEVSVQPVSRSLYQKMGLDFEKNYVSILSTSNIDSLARDESPDLIVIDNESFETVGKTDWDRSAGWVRVVCVSVNTNFSGT